MWEDNIKMNLKEIGQHSMDWNDVVEERDKWQALVNTVTTLQEISLIAKDLPASQEGLCSWELVTVW